jgi:putative DNA primase/helicase
MTFRAFIENLGLIPPESIEPGRTMRCATEIHPRKRNGLVRLDEDLRGGIAVNYESGETPMQWRENGEQKERDLSADNAARSARIAKRGASEAEGTRRAREIYAAAVPLRGVKQ